jgi:molybdenum cofactor biosynthesis enzyme MoaA
MSKSTRSKENSMVSQDLLEELEASCGSITKQAGGTLIQGAERPWAYAASAALTGKGAAKIRALAKLTSGSMSIGVLSKSGTEFLMEYSIPITNDFVPLELAVPDVERSGHLILRTHADASAQPRLELKSLTLETLNTSIAAGSKVDPIVENLWPLETSVYNIPAMRRWTRSELQKYMTADSWKDNLILNKYEFATGASKLESFPWRFSVPFVLCNARCEFCSAWLVKGKPMPVDLIDRLAVVLPYLAEIDLVGWGEPLIHPEFGHILDQLRKRADRRARIALTTNGVHLEKWVDRLVEAGVKDYAISIHAATAATHEDLMGLPPGSFAEVLQGVRALISKRGAFPRLTVGLVFIVTKQNLAEIPEFIGLAERLGVDSVFIRTLKSRSVDEQRQDGLDYHRLPPYLHSDFEFLRARASEAIRNAKVKIEVSPETWDTKVFPAEVEAEILKQPLTPREVRRASKSFHRTPPPDTPESPLGEMRADADEWVHEQLENPYNRSAPLLCPSPYTALYINGFDRAVSPCCYMITVPGYEGSYLRKGASFDQVWNSPAMIGLRKSLNQGPLKQPCLKCAFYW